MADNTGNFQLAVVHPCNCTGQIIGEIESLRVCEWYYGVEGLCYSPNQLFSKLQLCQPHPCILFVYVCVCAYVYMYVCVYVCMSVRVYVCLSIVHVTCAQ